MNFGRKKMFALGRLKTGQMNKLESMYSAHLNSLMLAGEVAWFEFEAVKLRLANNTFLTVDFFVMLSTGELQAHECKGFMMEDANVKLKVAQERFPFRFFLVKAVAKKDGGGFTVKEIGA